MSKGKKAGKAAAPPSVSWDEGLVSESLQDDCWRPYLVYVCPSTPSAQPYVDCLAKAATNGNRRRFEIIERNSMLQSAREDAKLATAGGGGGAGGGKKSKQSAHPPSEKPLYVVVCERVVEALGAPGGVVPPSLVARMLKYTVLQRRTKDRAREEALRKEAEEALKPQKSGPDGKKGGGRTSKMAVGKKGKETPAPDAASSVPVPQKPPTSMVKRGEEDLDSKYIDDEPADGPSCYFILLGFISTELFPHLAPIKLTAHILFNMVHQSSIGIPANLTEEEAAERRETEICLAHFWEGLGGVVRASPSGSMLRDMGRLEVSVGEDGDLPEEEEALAAHSQALFDRVAQLAYLTLEHHKQYQHYLGYLDLHPLQLASNESRAICELETAESTIDIACTSRPVSGIQQESQMPSVDKRLYSELMSAVPVANSSVGIMLHCMVEQVSATLSEGGTKSEENKTSNGLHPDVAAELDRCLASLALPAKDLKITDKVAPTKRSPAVVSHWDLSRKRTLHLQDSRLLKMVDSEQESLCLSAMQSILKSPEISKELSLHHSAALHAVQHFCLSSSVSPQSLDYSLIILSLEHLSVPSASVAPDFSFPDAQQAMLSSRLLFDVPLQIPLKKKSLTSSSLHALVEYKADAGVSESDGKPSAVKCSSEGLKMSSSLSKLDSDGQELDLPSPLTNLCSYTSVECLKGDSLVQILHHLSATHPYMQALYHHLSRSTVIVVSTGFDGKLIHSYKWSSQSHSKVGFQNFLQYVLPKYASQIDKAVQIDTERRDVFEEENKRLLEEKLKVLQQQPSAEATAEDKESEALSVKGSKRASVAKKTPAAKSPEKKSKTSSKAITPTSSTVNVSSIEESLPKFEERKLFSAYNVGDVVLLTEGTTTTQFTADGVQICTEEYHFVDDDGSLRVSILDDRHTLSVGMLLNGGKSKSTTAVTQPVVQPTGDQIPNEGKSETAEGSGDTEEKDVVVAGIPEPPDGIGFACLKAHFYQSLSLSLSHYGPKGTGQLPYKPAYPAILQESDRSESSNTSRPQSQQAQSPAGKLSKKQQEQQQQLLEQQRLLEEEKAREREIAQNKFHEQCNSLKRHNKYQQLFVGTPHGLQVNCHIMADLSADPTITDGSDGVMVVRQGYPTRSSGKQSGEEHLVQAAYKEKQRCSLPDGSLVRYMCDGSIIIQCPNGNIYRSATESERKQFKASSLSGKSDTTSIPSREASEGIERITSAARVTFAQESPLGSTDEGKEESQLDEAVWVVTTAKGEQFMQSDLRKDIHSSTTLESPDEDGSGDTSQKPGLDDGNGQKERGAEGDGSAEQVGEESVRDDAKSEPCTVWLRQLRSYPAMDPISKEVLITREDNVILVIRPDGTYISEHPDGTRFTTLPPNGGSEELPQVVMECPGFARVVSTPSQKKSTLDFWDGSQVICSLDGSYHATKNGSFSLKITSSGEAFYSKTNKDGAQLVTSYKIDHTATGCLVEATDCTGNVFSVSKEGVPAVSPASGVKIKHHQAFLPRYFIVNADSRAYELLDKDSVDVVVASVRPDPNCVVLEETIPTHPGCTSTTILKPLTQLDDPPAHVVPFLERCIIPGNLRVKESSSTSNDIESESTSRPRNGRRRFGECVGRGLSIGTRERPTVKAAVLTCPEALEYRQFLNFCDLSGETRDQVLGGLATYTAWLEKQKRDADLLLPIDSRTADEKESAEQLKARWNQNGSPALEGTLQTKYTKEISKLRNTTKHPPPRNPEKLSAFLEDAKEELETAERTKAALRNQAVPMYFDSQEAQEHSRLLSPDMAALTADLARPKVEPELLHSECSTPFTLQSASVTIITSDDDGRIGTETPDLGPVSSLSKIRPSHPTPDHAHRNGTPTDVRPSNPTPSHALKSSSSRSNSNGGKVPPAQTANQELCQASRATTAVSSPVDVESVAFETKSTERGPTHGLKEISVSFNLPHQSNEGGAVSTNPESFSHMDEPEQHAAVMATSGASPRYKSTYLDVTSKPRSVAVNPPHSVLGGRPGEAPNLKFAMVEDAACRRIRTSSTAEVSSTLRRRIEVWPQEVDFGTLREGCTYSQPVALKNTGVEACRFRIKQPPPSTAIKAVYSPGPVAAGLSTQFDVEIFAMAVGAVGEHSVGQVRHDLEITSENSILQLPIKATVLTNSAYCSRYPGNMLGGVAPEVRLIVDRPQSRETITRPQRT